jgi:hypothetical protein
LDLKNKGYLGHQPGLCRSMVRIAEQLDESAAQMLAEQYI